MKSKQVRSPCVSLVLPFGVLVESFVDHLRKIFIAGFSEEHKPIRGDSGDTDSIIGQARLGQTVLNLMGPGRVVTSCL